MAKIGLFEGQEKDFRGERSYILQEFIIRGQKEIY